MRDPITTPETIQTTAQQVADALNNDGQLFVTADGRTLSDLAEEHEAHIETDGMNWERYTFPDGSIITAVGCGWDYGYADCLCWQAGGHNAECEDR